MDPTWTTWPQRADDLAELTVVVLYGGSSVEREVSLRSGPAIIESLSAPSTACPVGLGEVLGVEVGSHGSWRLGAEQVSPQQALAALPQEALFFLGLHGGEGEDGRLQGLLESSGRRYTGSGPAASALCMCKGRAREVVSRAGLRVAPGVTLERGQPLDGMGWAAETRPSPASRWFVKPERGGSSVGITRVQDPERLLHAVEKAFLAGDDVLLEREVLGLEVTAGVVGNRDQATACLPLCEIVPREGHFFDYEEKYSEGGAQEFCPPRQAGAELAARVQQLAQTGYRALGCDGYARLDFILPQDGSEPVFLEANTLPGFTARSLLPLAAAATGVDFRGLCLEILCRALVRPTP